MLITHYEPIFLAKFKVFETWKFFLGALASKIPQLQFVVATPAQYLLHS